VADRYTAKQLVLTAHPGAWVYEGRSKGGWSVEFQVCVKGFTGLDGSIVGRGKTESKAWQDAARNIVRN